MSLFGERSIRQILLVIVGILTSLIVLLTLRETYHSWQRLDNIRMLKAAMEIADDLIDTAEHMAVERDAIYTMLDITEGKGQIIRPRMAQSREQANRRLDEAFAALQYYSFEDVIPVREKTRAKLTALNELRQEIDTALILPPAERDKTLSQKWFAQITELISTTQDLRFAFTRHYTHIDPIVTQHMTFKHFLWVITEYAGRERAAIGHLIVSQSPITATEQKNLLLWNGIARMGWTTAKNFARHSGLYSPLSSYLEEAESHYFTVFDTIREVFYDPDLLPEHRTYPLDIELWYGLATQAIDSLFELKAASQKEVQAFINNAESTAWLTITINVLMLVFSLALSIYIIWVILYRVIRPIDRMVTALFNVAGLQSAEPLELSPQKDEISKLAYVLKMYRKTNSIIRENEARLRNIIDNTVDGLITINNMGIIETYNMACEHLFGYKASEVIGKNVKILMPEPYFSEHDQYLKNYRDTGKKKIIGIGREVHGKRKDGSVFPMDLSVSEVHVGDETFYSGIIRDITDRKRAEGEREQFTQKLAESNEELERFAYVASHDLKAPLRAIDNLSQWIEEDLGEKIEGETKDYMDTLRQRVHRMEELLDDLLAYSRVGRRMDDSYEELLPGNELLDDIVALISPSKSFTIKISPKFADIQMRRMPMQQILFNLINNAIKHHDKKKGTVEVGAEDKGDHYLFSVKDDGPGIPEEFQEKIFEMFQTLKPRDEVEGSGIGLAIVKKAVKIHGGEIFLDSKPGKGSTFSFTWPKSQKKEAARDEK